MFIVQGFEFFLLEVLFYFGFLEFFLIIQEIELYMEDFLCVSLEMVLLFLFIFIVQNIYIG